MPENSLPIAKIYVRLNQGHAEVVMQLERPEEPSVVSEVARQVESETPLSGASRMRLAFSGDDIITLIGVNRKHTPSILLARAKLLAERLGHQAQTVAPPS